MEATAQHDTRHVDGDVLIVGPFPPPVHGAAIVTERFAALVKRRGLVASTVDTSVNAGSRFGYTVRRIQRHLAATSKLLHRNGRGTAYICGVGGNAFSYHVLLLLTCWLTRTNVFYHHHSFAYLDRKRFLPRLVFSINRHRVVHIALGSEMTVLLNEVYGISAVLECSNAAFISANEPPTKTSNRATFTIAHLANLSFEKGLQRVLDTFILCRRTFDPSIRVQLRLGGEAAGEGELRALRSLETEYGANVEQWGFVREDQKHSFFEDVDLFVFPSLYEHEAEPLVVLEAASFDVPSVAFDVGCIRSIADTKNVFRRDADFASSAVERAVQILEQRNSTDHVGATSARFEARREKAANGYESILQKISLGNHFID